VPSARLDSVSLLLLFTYLKRKIYTVINQSLSGTVKAALHLHCICKNNRRNRYAVVSFYGVYVIKLFLQETAIKQAYFP
jgi:hypothetical protein